MAFTQPWDLTKPADTDLASTLGDAVRDTRRDVAERINVEHYYPAADSSFTGKHKQGSARVFMNPSSTPPPNDPDVPGALWRASDTGAIKVDLGTTWADFISVAGFIPSGVIMAWNGTLASIPAGWHLCDGTNGTPDFRDRFLKGAPVGAGAGGLGGATLHSHTVTSPDHTHNVSGVTGLPDQLTSATAGGNSPASSNHVHSFSGVTSSGGSGVNTSSLADGQPPFYKVLWIMKL